MRKYLVYVFISLTVISCTKESVTPPQQQQPQEQQPQVSSPFNPLSLHKLLHKKESTELAFQWYNECYPETVDMSGTITQFSKSFKRKDLVVTVGILNYNKVSGVGLISGLTYKGGGEVRDTIVTYADNSGIGWTTAKASWSTSQGNAIIIDEYSFYNFFPDGSGRLVYTIHNDTCR